MPPVVAAVIAGGVVGVGLAPAASAAPTAEEGSPTPDVTSPVPSADGDARTAAITPAPDWEPDPAPASQDPITVARAEAARTGLPVAVAGSESQTQILMAQPDGTLTQETASSPVRVEQDGDWVPIDTTLTPDPDTGVLVPAAVVGERTVSDGGSGPLATVADGDTSLAFSWPTALPEPDVEGGTATYRDVIDGVDLVVTVTSVGFSQHLVIDAPLADPASVGALSMQVTATGGTVTAGEAGSLQLVEAAGAGDGEVAITAGAPVMWDAASGAAAGSDGDVEPVATELTEAGQLLLTPDLGFLTDPGTVYPVVIDPAPALTALGDASVRSTTPNDPPSTSTDLMVGSPDGTEANRSFLRFDITPVPGWSMASATLELWNSYSTSCSPRETVVSRVADFDPATVTWNSQPNSLGRITSSMTTLGFDASCAAGPAYFEVTSGVASASQTSTVMAFSVTANEADTDAYKTFNAGSAGSNVPTLTVVYTDQCQVVSGYKICGEIRDAWNAAGGLSGWGAPLHDTAPTLPRSGLYQAFDNNGGEALIAIWSPEYGVHPVLGAHADKYSQMGWENSWLGFPIGDEFPVQGAQGWVQDFEHGSIYWHWSTGAFAVRSDYVAHYRGIGAQDGYLGYPVSDTYAAGSGGYTEFQGGILAWDQGANTIERFAGWLGLAGLPGWGSQLDFRLTDTVDAKVNAGTGNLNISVTGLATAGIGGDRTVGLTYNSMTNRMLGTPQASDAGTGLLNTGWRLTDVPDTRLAAYGDSSVRYFDPSGRTVLYRWNGTAYEAPTGDGGTSLTRDANNNWVLTTLASDRKQTFRASDGVLLTDADRNGNTYTFSYDSTGMVTGVTGTRGGATITFNRGGSGIPGNQLQQLSQTIDGTTRTVTFGYDSTSGHLTSITDASGKTTTLEWTDELLTGLTDPRGIATAFQYDTFSRITQVVRDYGGNNYATGFEWATENRNGILTAVTRVTDPLTFVTSYTVDGFGKVKDATDPRGHKKATTYSPNNDVLTAVDAMPGANTTSYTYNGAEGGFSPTGATSPTGASASASYPTSGSGPERYQATSSTDTEGNSTTYAYDQAGNPTETVSGGVITSTTYNPPAGQPAICTGGGRPGQPCATIDGRGNATAFTYNSVGNLTTVTPPNGAAKPTSYTYDGAGRVKTATDGKGQITTYVYDKNDRVVQIRYNGATNCTTAANCQVYTYDADGNLTKRVDAGGTTTWTWNSRNLLSGQTSAASSGGGSKSSTLTYDAAGNLTAFTEAGAVTRYGYDAGNNLVSLAEPGGSCTGTVSLCTRYEYNANDVRTKITYPGGTTVNYLQIDASNRPLQYKATTSSGAVLMDFTYSFSNSGTDSGLVRTRSDATVAGTAVQTYTYDELNRLTQATERIGTTTSAQWTYCYDANGNRTYDSTSTAASVPCPDTPGGPAPTYTYDATDALAARTGFGSFAYDNNGAETASAGTLPRSGGVWNARGQLTSIITNGTAHSLAYTGEGNQERTSLNGSGYQNNALGVTTQTGTGAHTIVREPSGTPVAIRISGISYYYIADRQNSTIAIVGSTGVKRNSYSYDPYGLSRGKNEQITNPYQYIGARFDAITGLYHLQARYYDPSIGRFTQTDPSGQDAAAYAYANSNPVNYSDPTGEVAPLLGLAAGALLRAVARPTATRIAGWLSTPGRAGGANNFVARAIGNSISKPSGARWFGTNPRGSMNSNASNGVRIGMSGRKGEANYRPSIRTGNKIGDHYFLD